MNMPGERTDIEQLLQNEQEAIAQLVNDAAAVLGGAAACPSKAALRERAEKLSPAARITARVLTKLRLDSRYPPKRPD